MCGMSDGSKTGAHHEISPSEVARGEAAVKRAIGAVNGFLNPFEINNKTRLYIISSGAPVSQDIERDVMRAEEAGHAAKEKFVRERLLKVEGEENHDFYDRLPKLKLLTMAKTNKKTKLTSSQGKLVQYREQGDIAFQLLIKSQLLEHPISIEDLMTYCITPVPHSIGTPDGYMAKTDKSKMVAYLTSEVQGASALPQDDEKTFFIDDGNARLYTLKELPDTFQLISLKILKQLPWNQDVLFSTDMYIHGSVKSQERARRGASEKLILEGINTQRPADFKAFLLNDENKTQLFDLMLRVWSSDCAASHLQSRKVMLVVQGRVFCLTSPDGLTVEHSELHSLESNQEETDTRIVLYIAHAQAEGYDRVVIRSPDSDVFFILLHYAHTFQLTILFDTGSGDKRRVMNITALSQDLGDDYCQCLLGLYIFTGEDANCAFK